MPYVVRDDRGKRRTCIVGNSSALPSNQDSRTPKLSAIKMRLNCRVSARISVPYVDRCDIQLNVRPNVASKVVQSVAPRLCLFLCNPCSPPATARVFEHPQKLIAN